MEVRVLLEQRIEPRGDLSVVIQGLQSIALRYSSYDRVCIEHNSGFGSGGWFELVGYRPENEKEIAARKKKEGEKKRIAAKNIKKKKAEIKKLEKEYSEQFGE